MTAQSRFSLADKLRVIVFLVSRVKMLALDSSTSIRFGLLARENHTAGLNLDENVGAELAFSAGAFEPLDVPFTSEGSVVVAVAGIR